ncbi:MAG: hypothetical protein AAGH74_01630 [Pseudomonadota bacterium]
MLKRLFSGRAIAGLLFPALALITQATAAQAIVYNVNLGASCEQGCTGLLQATGTIEVGTPSTFTDVSNILDYTISVTSSGVSSPSVLTPLNSRLAFSGGVSFQASATDLVLNFPAVTSGAFEITDTDPGLFSNVSILYFPIFLPPPPEGGAGRLEIALQITNSPTADLLPLDTGSQAFGAATQFVIGTAAVPLPGPILLLLSSLGAIAVVSRRSRGALSEKPSFFPVHRKPARTFEC